jgi:hypothetical protein
LRRPISPWPRRAGPVLPDFGTAEAEIPCIDSKPARNAVGLFLLRKALLH